MYYTFNSNDNLMKEVRKMKRSAIRGWTWKVFGYRIEFVTINHIIRVIAFYNKNNIGPTKRLEW
jgi:hypothetical protein